MSSLTQLQSELVRVDRFPLGEGESNRLFIIFPIANIGWYATTLLNGSLKDDLKFLYKAMCLLNASLVVIRFFDIKISYLTTSIHRLQIHLQLYCLQI